jgi:glycosyltransferase involved in cell wall biosynthesis
VLQKLAIISTHPIQYNAPLFALLHSRAKIQVKVFYTWSQLSSEKKFDPGFGKEIEWDIPLLDGYESCFVFNKAKKPGSSHFFGINNPSLHNEVQAWGANAVLIYGWSFVSHLKAIIYFKGKIPVLFRGDSTLIDEKPNFKRLLRRVLLTWVYSKTDICLYPGEANKQYLLKHKVSKEKMKFMPHAIDNTRFKATSHVIEKANVIRQRLGIGKEKLVFLFAGKLEHKKEPLMLAKAFMQMANIDAHLIFVGNGVLEADLKLLCAGYSNIHFMGFQNQLAMPAIYAVCDVFVLPSSHNETWGLALNEAMASAKPVIASSACGAAENLVVEGKTGFTFPSIDFNRLKQLMAHCIDSKPNLKQMGENAFEFIQKYSFINQAVAIEKSVGLQIS